ncbi:hypothetical protein [Hoeflea olei]|uniref:Uncharacterized protein n=1 Tax=Hoeflea olei TaxID=1480615 RepID=A0A1C1YT93_9HYPH|nr:hypothetical protein [Hoeflea olei]OCW56715.1 hypothetical protein AWJ14_17455 [Hoeflea olei]
MLFTAITLFWISFLSLLALVVTYAPHGGVEIAGLRLFAGTGLVDAAIAAMQRIGLGPFGRSVGFGILGGLNIAAAGLMLFAMMFGALGEALEQRQARPLAEGATACAAAAAALVVAVSFAGGEAGALLVLQLTALGGLLLTLSSFARIAADAGRAEGAADDLDAVIAEHAASHAAFSARLAAFTRSGAGS